MLLNFFEHPGNFSELTPRPLLVFTGLMDGNPDVPGRDS